MKMNFSAHKVSVSAVIAASLSLAGVAGASAMESRGHQNELVPPNFNLVPNGKGRGVIDPTGKSARDAKTFSQTSTNGINYHGGPVMLDTAAGAPNVYYIWYGDTTSGTNGNNNPVTWNSNTATTILPTFASEMGNKTPYFKINATYYYANSSGIKTYLSGGANLKGQTQSADYSKFGNSLTDANVQQIVADAINAQQVPNDTNGVYFVLTAKGVNETSGFCTSYCGWHTHGLLNGYDIKYSFVGNPDMCPSACEAQTNSPNGNSGADGMASIIAHELSEAVTDPDLNAWYDKRGYENADKCAWNFGTTSKTSGGALYNVTWSNNIYLIQQNWKNANGGSCALQ